MKDIDSISPASRIPLLLCWENILSPTQASCTVIEHNSILNYVSGHIDSVCCFLPIVPLSSMTYTSAGSSVPSTGSSLT
jgi:hypothetical protein